MHRHESPTQRHVATELLTTDAELTCQFLLTLIEL